MEEQQITQKPLGKLAVISLILAVFALALCIFVVCIYYDIQAFRSYQSDGDAAERVAAGLAVALGLVPAIAFYIISALAGGIISAAGIIFGSLALAFRKNVSGTPVAIAGTAVSAASFAVVLVYFILIL